MSAAGLTTAPSGPAPRWQWPAGLLVVLALHAAALLVLRDMRPAFEPLPAPPPAILLDLAPSAPQALPVAESAPEPPTPTAIPQALPPVPEPTPVPAFMPEPPPLPPAPVPTEAVLPPPRPLPITRPRPPQPKPAVRPVPPRAAVAQRASPAPPATPAVPATATAPAAPVQAVAVAASPGPAASIWPGLLAAHLARFRHYPAEAERRGFTGVAMMRFSVDASGRIVSASLARSSGHDILDEEAELWLRRAQPLPPPPPDRAAPAQILLPLSFVLH